jgi:hypothetical protein
MNNIKDNHANDTAQPTTWLETVWDFIFGIMLIGVTPVLTLIIVSFIFDVLDSILFNVVSPDGFFGTILAGIFLSLILVSSLVSLWFVCRWRRSHRRAPYSLFPGEVVFGILFGFIFMAVLIFSFAITTML